jgi:hypothetical protein
MPEQQRTVEQENTLERERLRSQIRDRARIFREVLGTPRGQLVIEALMVNFKTGSSFPPNQLDDHGRTDALQTWRKLGHFDVLQFIKLQLEWKESDYVNTSSGST